MSQAPIAIERIERWRGRSDVVRLSLSGRWLGPEPTAHEPLLVVSMHGRRHRFPPNRDGAAAAPPPGCWAVSFTLPFWAEPTLPGQAALWVGESAVPVPPPGQTSFAAVASTPPAVRDAAAAGDRARAGDAGPTGDAVPAGDSARVDGVAPPSTPDMPGPPAPAAADETPPLLAALEAAQTEMRRDMRALMASIGDQRREFERRLAETVRERATLDAKAAAAADEREALARRAAEAQVSRDAAVSEMSGLQAELQRLGTELAVTREQLAAQAGDLGDAERLLAATRALGEQLRQGTLQPAPGD
jgi:hypothetical protein